MSTIKVWFLLFNQENEALGDPASVNVPSNATIEDLKKKIEAENENLKDALTVWRVKTKLLSAESDVDELVEDIKKIEFKVDATKLTAGTKVSSLNLISCRLLLSRTLSSTDHNKVPSGDSDSVYVSLNATIGDLKKAIKAQNPEDLANVNLRNLTVWRCIDKTAGSESSKNLKKRIKNFNFSEDNENVKEVDPETTMEELKLNHKEKLLVQVAGFQDQTEKTVLLHKYDKVFIRANQSNHFSTEDIGQNNIVKWPGNTLPDFVKEFDTKLKTQRSLPVYDSKALLREFDLDSNIDFGDRYRLTASARERKERKRLELMHVLTCSSRAGGIDHWKESMETAAEIMKCSSGSRSWPWSLLVRVPDNPLPLPYTPKSDVSWWKRGFPRLLAEIFSENSHDHSRLCVQSGASVRLANFELQEQNEPKKFVLIALYVDSKFVVHRYLFFKDANDEAEKSPKGKEVQESLSSMSQDLPAVYYSLESISLHNNTEKANAGCDRLLIISQLYNLIDSLENDSPTAPKGEPMDHMKLARLLRADSTRSFSTRTSADGGSKKNKSKSNNAKDKNVEGGRPVLDSLKYELVDESKPLFRQQKNVYRVRLIGDTGKKSYIAKRLHPDLNELQILQELAATKMPCDHIIQLIETIETNVGLCIVLPELKLVEDQLYYGHDGGTLRGHYINLSRDLARGVTFLHDHGIAHLDIKPPNLVYTDEYRLQIIDFDISVHVKDENEEIEGYNGTELFKAPEIGPIDGKGFFYSPIKADRYSCGVVLKEFVDFGGIPNGKDEGLGEFAARLMTREPNARPQLREWREAPR